MIEKHVRKSDRANRPNVTVMNRKIRRQLLKNKIGSNRIQLAWGRVQLEWRRMQKEEAG